jgi:uroporphyrinogen decarboxylase
MKSLVAALRGERQAVPPLWLMRQAGRYLPEYRKLRETAGDFLTLCYTPDFATEVTLQPVRRFGLDAAILFSDILVVPHGLGMSLAFREGEGPVLEPLRSASELARLEPARLLDRLAPVYEAVRRVKRDLPAEAALIGFAGAPWTLATYMVEGGSSREFRRVKDWAYREPGSFVTLIERLTEATIAHLGAQIEAGAEAVQLFDSWAGVLPEAPFRAFVIEPTRRIVAALKARFPEVPLIGFPRGAGLLYPDYVATTGVAAVALDQHVPLSAAQAMQRQCPVQGNLDPLLLVLGGAAMDEAARTILAALRQGPFIFNLGHGIVPETPPAHVARLVELVRG